MATQSGTLKAGYQLYIDIQNGDSSTVFEYTVTGASVRDNGKAWKSDRVIGPFSEDVSFSVTSTGAPLIYKVQPNGQREYTADTLPDPATLSQAITRYEITDYGGNIATVVNGAWRFEYPFRTTWAGRPAVNLVPVGTELQVTDYANQKWISDGTYWRPAQGKVLLAQKSRTTAAALAVISNSAAGQFTIPGGNPKIPGGMLIPGSKLRVEAGTVKSGATAAYSMAARLGKNGITASDIALGSIGGTLTPDGVGSRMDLIACFSTETNAFFRTGNTTLMGQTQGNMYMSSSAAIDTTADMYVTFDILTGNAADTYSLAFFSIWLEA